MKFILNNRPEEVDREEITISDLLALKKYTFRMLVIKLNGKLIRQEEYANTRISENDNVNILHLISGG